MKLGEVLKRIPGKHNVKIFRERLEPSTKGEMFRANLPYETTTCERLLYWVLEDSKPYIKYDRKVQTIYGAYDKENRKAYTIIYI